MSRKKKKPLDAAEDFGKPAKQERLAGMADAAIEEIEAAAEKCKHLEQRRMTLLRQEMEARDLLGDIMQKHGRSSYRYHGWEVTTTEVKTKVKVKFHQEEADGALPDNANPGGANTSGEVTTPTGAQEQYEVAGASTEDNQEVKQAREEGGGDPPF